LLLARNTFAALVITSAGNNIQEALLQAEEKTAYEFIRALFSMIIKSNSETIHVKLSVLGELLTRKVIAKQKENEGVTAMSLNILMTFLVEQAKQQEGQRKAELLQEARTLFEDAEKKYNELGEIYWPGVAAMFEMLGEQKGAQKAREKHEQLVEQAENEINAS
jgi:hypothetical protein